MDFSWNEDDQSLQQAALEFAQDSLNDGLMERETSSQFNLDGWQKCAELGIHGLIVPANYGGSGFGPLTAAGVLEKLGYGCLDNGLLFSINAHMWTALLPILEFGNDQQKNTFLRGLCDGSLIGGNAMSEPDSGSDAFNMKTIARRTEGGFKISGSKTWVTNAPIADLLIVYADIEGEASEDDVTAFIVRTDNPGITVGRPIEKMGLRTSPMASIYFDEYFVSEEEVLGNPGQGKSVFTHSMTWERGYILASAVGTMERLTEQSVLYARTRKQFGQPIGQFQFIAEKIVEMRVRLDAARAALYKMAWMRERGKNVFMEAALAKLVISQAWQDITKEAIQIHGGLGYMQEGGIEREHRDAMGSTLYSGTSEIQKLLISSLMNL